MRVCQWILTCVMAVSSLGCSIFPQASSSTWKEAVNRQVGQLGYRNWVIVAEASFPAHSRQGFRQVTADVDVPEAVDYVLNALEQTQHVRPRVYLPPEQRSVENDFAPGIDVMRKRIHDSLHGHETTELEQQSLLTLLEDASRSFDVLVIRTHTALPYSSVFLELQPGYWDADSENRLRDRMNDERMRKISRPNP
jgi:hypothetical protein